MKKIIYVAALLIMVSCASKKVNFSELQDRNGLFYLANDAKPFTGQIVSYAGGKIEFEGEMKNGLREGLWTYYYPNGQKQMEGMYTDGLKEGTWSFWKENGEQDPVEIYKMGNRLGNETVSEQDTTAADTTAQAATVTKTSPAAAKPAEKKPEPKKQNPVEWERLHGGPVKFLNGQPYTGPVIKHYKTGGAELEGNFYNGKRSGKWIFYDKFGNTKDVRYY
jgi:antitoxin component YwqK of YwqJK toxin-antitoxin module